VKSHMLMDVLINMNTDLVRSHLGKIGREGTGIVGVVVDVEGLLTVVGRLAVRGLSLDQPAQSPFARSAPLPTDSSSIRAQYFCLQLHVSLPSTIELCLGRFETGNGCY
jgi:hypothetical protein